MNIYQGIKAKSTPAVLYWWGLTNTVRCLEHQVFEMQILKINTPTVRIVAVMVIAVIACLVVSYFVGPAAAN